MTWSTYFPKSTHNAQRTTHISHNSAQKLFISSARQGVFCAHTNFRCKSHFFGVKPVLFLFLVFALVSCDPPKSPKPCAAGEPTGANRFTLTPKADNTYTLTIAECVKTIAEGEFSAEASVGSGASKKDFDSKLTGKLGATPREAVTTIVLPSTLETIGDYAFYNHTKVTGTLTIPKQVQSIGESSFNELGAVSSALDITFAVPSQLGTLGEKAFNSARTSVLKLPQSLENIGISAFQDLRGLSAVTTFTIPANVKNVGAIAFFIRRTPISGTLIIESSHLVRTPADTTQARTGSLGDGLFVFNRDPRSNFTTIQLPKAVYDSYTTADLNIIFGTGVTYQDLNGNPHPAKTS